MIKRQTPKRVTLPNGKHFMQNIREQQEMRYLQMYILDVHINREQLHVEEEGELYSVEEVLNLL